MEIFNNIAYLIPKGGFSLKLFVSDLYGTLLNDKQELSETTVKTINNLIDKGLNFTIATARSLDTAWRIIEPLRLKLPIILNNGVFVYNPITNENIISNFVEKCKTENILRLIEEKGISPLVYTTNNQKENRVYYKGIFNKAQEDYISDRLKRGDRRFRITDDLKASLKQNVISIACIGGNKIEEVYKTLKEKLDLTYHYTIEIYTKEPWLEISNKAANKKKSLEFLREYLQADEIIAFGDNLNDLPMFEVSNYCYAVENADILVKQAATNVIDSNIKNGVAIFLEEYFNREVS